MDMLLPALLTSVCAPESVLSNVFDHVEPLNSYTYTLPRFCPSLSDCPKSPGAPITIWLPKSFAIATDQPNRLPVVLLSGHDIVCIVGEVSSPFASCVHFCEPVPPGL